jgi:hypothetical protein
MKREKKYKKPGDGGWTGWQKALLILAFIVSACFLAGVVLLAVGKFAPVSGIDPNAVTMILALFSLNLAVAFFIPMLITKNQITDTVRNIVDQKFFEEKMERYATQMNIASLLQKMSTLLFQQERHIWALSCALNALNEYMKITPDKPTDSIRNLWISIESMTNIVVNKYTNSSLLKNEFHISNEEIEIMKEKNWSKEIQSKVDQLTLDKKDMLMRFYIEIFMLAYQKEYLIHIIGYKFKEQINYCLDNYFIKIINDTVKECDIKYEEIKSEIRDNAAPFENSETRGTAEETLKNLIKN